MRIHCQYYQLSLNLCSTYIYIQHTDTLYKELLMTANYCDTAKSYECKIRNY